MSTLCKVLKVEVVRICRTNKFGACIPRQQKKKIPILCRAFLAQNLPIEKRNPDGPLRIPILDKQKDRGIVIHGKVMQGTVRVGDKISLSPHNTPSQVG